MEVKPAHLVQRRRRFTDKKIEDLKDPIFEWLLKTGKALNVNDRGFVEIECPWGESHSDGRLDGAGYSPLDYVTAGRTFSCFHAGCASRSWVEFLRWVSSEGGPGLDYGLVRTDP